MKDNIDFGSMDISTLFRKLLIPTVLGMVFSAIFVITDGIFVGKGIGSDALAAVNITAPLFMITTGVGLMFGVGASVVASIHLSHGKQKAAGINITQALVFSSLLILLLSALCFFFMEPVARLLGSSDRLLPGVTEYMSWYVPFLVFYLLLNASMFFVRLDGAPNYAMMCNAIAAIANIVLDYVFIFILGWGLMGAAFATSIGTMIGAVMTLVYLFRYSKNIILYPIKMSRKSMQLTFRNIGYMVKLGSSAFVSEASIASMMLLGNYVFIRYLGEDGVAAFSIVCYFFPIIFMVYNAIAQSAQPIISYNFGAGSNRRVHQALRLSIKTALGCGVFFFVMTVLCNRNIVSLFIDRSFGAYRCGRTSLFCHRICILCPEHSRHRILPEHRTGSPRHHHHVASRNSVHVGRFHPAAPPAGSTGHLACRTFGGITDFALHYRNLFERPFSLPPKMRIFAAWRHLKKSSGIDITFQKQTFKPC